MGACCSSAPPQYRDDRQRALAQQQEAAAEYARSLEAVRRSQRGARSAVDARGGAGGPSGVAQAAVKALAHAAASALGIGGQQMGTHREAEGASPLSTLLPHFAEFAPALEQIALAPAWIKTSRLSRYTDALSANAVPELGAAEAQAAMQMLIVKAYKVAPAQAGGVRFHGTEITVMSVLVSLHSAAHGRKALGAAYAALSEFGRADELNVLMWQAGSLLCSAAGSNVADRGEHGVNMFVMAAGNVVERRFNAAVSRAMNSAANTPAKGAAPPAAGAAASAVDPASSQQNLDDVDTAHARFVEIFSDFLDEYKQRAFYAAFVEPSHYYYFCKGDQAGYNAVDQHAVNYWLVLVEEGLGFRLPMSSIGVKDSNNNGFIDFWAGFGEGNEEKVWSVFSSPTNFGKSGPSLRDELGGRLPLHDPLADDAFHPRGDSESFKRRLTVDAKLRARFVKAIERFGYFFSYRFFVAKALETLNAERKVEHSGFRRACQTLFKEFQSRGLDAQLAPQPEPREGDGQNSYANFDDFCYNEFFTELQVDRVAMFFAWLEVISPPKGEEHVIAPSPFAPKQHSPPVVPILEEGSAAGGAGAAGAGAGRGGDHRQSAAGAMQSLSADPSAAYSSAASPAAASKGGGSDFVDDRHGDDDGDAGVAAANAKARPVELSAATLTVAVPQPRVTGLVWPAEMPNFHDRMPRQESPSLFDFLGGGGLERESTSDQFETTCPICWEKKPDVEVLEHVAAVGNVQDHKLCGQCRLMMKNKDVCPFCFSALQSDKFVTVAQGFVAEFTSIGNADDANRAASLFESWEMLELEFGSQIVLERVALHALKDPRLGDALVHAGNAKARWLYKLGGVVFRLYCIVHERRPHGALAGLEPRIEQGLKQAVEAIVVPFEDGSMAVSGAEWGNFYNQVLASLLLPYNTGLPYGTMVELARRIARAMVKRLNAAGDQKNSTKQQVKQYVIQQYVNNAKHLLWSGGRDEFADAFLS